SAVNTALEDGMRLALTKLRMGSLVDPRNTLPAPMKAAIAKIFGSGGRAAAEADAAAADAAGVKPALPEKAASAGEPQVLSVQEARTVINETDVKVKARIGEIKEQMKAKGLEMSPEQERQVYMTRFYRE